MFFVNFFKYFIFAFVIITYLYNINFYLNKINKKIKIKWFKEYYYTIYNAKLILTNVIIKK